MGNRCVITTEENWKNNGVGVYLHWNGGKDSVTAFLKYCELKGYRAPEDDNYGWARLCQVCGNFFGGSTSVGVDQVKNLDCEGDNGVYIIKDWKIVGRKNFNWEEQNDYDLDEMLVAIDSSMPVKEQLGKDFMKSAVIKPSEMKVGDTIAFMDWHGDIVKEKIIGIGKSEWVNGNDVRGVPYIGRYGDVPEKNPNNYLFDDKEYRKIG